MPALALRLVIVGTIAWAASAAYTLAWNPEVAFFKHGAAVKAAWVQKLDAAGKGKIVVCGGSSCTVTIDGERLLSKHGLPVANLGLGAGMGAKALVQFARQQVRGGDTLVVALEPRLLTEPLSTPGLGLQFAWATYNRELLSLALRESSSFTGISALLALRPGGYHVFTLLGKIASGQPLYRYAPSDFNVSGWQSVSVKRDISGPPERGARLSREAVGLLTELKTWCTAHGVRVAYALPWGYCPSDQADAFRAANADYLRQVAEILPVLQDKTLGVNTDREAYADTYWHLTPPAAAQRTDAFAEQLKSWALWEPAALDRLAGPGAAKESK